MAPSHGITHCRISGAGEASRTAVKRPLWAAAGEIRLGPIGKTLESENWPYIRNQDWILWHIYTNYTRGIVNKRLGLHHQNQKDRSRSHAVNQVSGCCLDIWVSPTIFGGSHSLGSGLVHPGSRPGSSGLVNCTKWGKPPSTESSNMIMFDGQNH
jgi:hypothetical protein